MRKHSLPPSFNSSYPVRERKLTLPVMNLCQQHPNYQHIKTHQGTSSVIPLYKVHSRKLTPHKQSSAINMNCVQCMTLTQDYLTVFLPSSLPHHLAVLAIENVLENPQNIKNKFSDTRQNLRKSVLDLDRNRTFSRSSVVESQFDSGNWSESVHTGVQEDEDITRGHKLNVHKAVPDDGDLRRGHKFDDIISRLDSATRQISGAVYNQNVREERGPRVTLARTSVTSDCENKLEEQKLKQILLSKLAKYKV